MFDFDLNPTDSDIRRADAEMADFDVEGETDEWVDSILKGLSPADLG